MERGWMAGSSITVYELIQTSPWTDTVFVLRVSVGDALVHLNGRLGHRERSRQDPLILGKKNTLIVNGLVM